MSDYSELKRLAVAAMPSDDSPHLPCTVAFDRAASPATVLALIAENERLKSDLNESNDLVEHLGDKRNALTAERDQLQAENEALRDDLEQTQYDADAWRNPDESVWVQVFLGEGDTPFISAVHGAICVDQIALIQGEVLENAEDYFEQGPGFYVFECRHCEAHYDNVGMTEPAHWEIDFSEHARFPWADEQTEMIKEAKHD
jgi:FtsZ-binding cell division protein ZapB